MSVSRRTFLGVAAAASVMARDSGPAPRCVVLDLGCILPESLRGYREFAALPAGRGSVAELVIVPGVASMPAVVSAFMDRGATVLVELFGSDRRTPDPYFPYIEYSWPVRTMIREFAAFPLRPSPGDEVIGTLGKHPVALCQRIGAGRLVTLGSPLGPVLLTGDPDAPRFLQALLAKGV